MDESVFSTFRDAASSGLAAWGRGGIGTTGSRRLPEFAPDCASLHGGTEAGAHSPSDRFGQRGLCEANRLPAGQLEGPSPFLRALCPNDAPSFGGVCALAPIPETQGWGT